MAYKLSPGINPISRVQIQVAQLECRFKGPLLTDDQVELLVDLVDFEKVNPQFFYEQKRVWVKEYKCFYYLDSGDGTDLRNWKRAKSRLMLEIYQDNEEYQQGDACHYGGKIFIALTDIEPNHNPIDFPDLWDVVTGEIETYRYLFQDTNSVLIYTDIKNPIFEVILGDFQYDTDGQIVIDPISGLAILTNQEIVYPYVYFDENEPPASGMPYRIDFYTDEVMSDQLFSGCVNVK
jgi:hypothetical protein